MGMLSEKEQRAEMSRTYDARTLARKAKVEELQSIITKCAICGQGKHWVANASEYEFEVNPPPELREHANAPLCQTVMDLREQLHAAGESARVQFDESFATHRRLVEGELRKLNEALVTNANALTKRIDAAKGDVITHKDWNDALSLFGEAAEKIAQLTSRVGQLEADERLRRKRGLKGLVRSAALKLAEVLA